MWHLPWNWHFQTADAPKMRSCCVICLTVYTAAAAAVRLKMRAWWRMTFFFVASTLVFFYPVYNSRQVQGGTRERNVLYNMMWPLALVRLRGSRWKVLLIRPFAGRTAAAAPQHNPVSCTSKRGRTREHTTNFAAAYELRGVLDYTTTKDVSERWAVVYLCARLWVWVCFSIHASGSI